MSSPHRAHAIHLVCTYMENKMAYEDSTGQDVNACSVNNSTLLSIYVDVDVCVCVYTKVWANLPTGQNLSTESKLIINHCSVCHFVAERPHPLWMAFFRTQGLGHALTSHPGPPVNTN